MPLIDRLVEGLDALCKHEEAQKRLSHHLMDPAAAYLARKLFKYSLVLGFLMVVQATMVTLLFFKFKAIT